MYTLYTGDCLDVMASLESVDAIITDPPYGLEFMGHQWDKLWAKRDKSHDLTGKKSSPFLAARVDKYKAGYEAQVWHEQWAKVALQILKPSHYLLAFGGTRTWHRLACALEDAGFEIRDTLMWLYGTGFPKGRANLKPSWEPIVLARKPGPMRELGIEECRVVTRYPANIIVDEETAELIGPPSRLFYCAKASPSERNAGLEGLEKRKSSKLGDGFASCVGHPNPNAKGHTTSGDRRAENYHPTVKPIALMRWLVRMVSREGETVLDPFMGSGTTGIACVLENRDFIGIEKEPDYMEIAKRRIEHHDTQQRLPV